MSNAPRFHTGEGMPSPELMQPPFDSVEVYGETIMTDDGQTLRDLMEKCPMDLSQVPQKMVNDYAIMAMNKCGAEIKAEHAPYMREVVESRDSEMKLTIRPEQPPETFEPARPVAEDSYAAVLTNLDSITVAAARQRQEQTVLQEMISLPTPVEKSEYSVDDSYYETEPPHMPDEATTTQMDAWLEQIEPKAPQLNSVPEAPLALVPETYVVDAPSNTAPDHETANQPEFMPVPSPSLAASQEEATSIAHSDAERPLTKEPYLGVDIVEAPKVAPSLDKISAEVYEPSAEPIGLAELLPDKVSVTETDLIQAEPAPLLAQLADHIKTDPDLNPEAAEAATELVERIDNLAEQLILAYAEADLSPDDLSAIEQELIEACQELLATLGIAYDEPTLRRITSTILKHKYEALAAAETQIALPQDEGTHEHKLFALQDFVFDIPTTLPAFHLLGRYVLWRHNQSSAAA